MFIDKLKDELNVSTTENGAVGYATTKSELVDFNFKVASYRSMTEKEIVKDFIKAWVENKELALKYLFYVRDIREGLGERRLFRVCVKEIVKELDNRVFNWIAEYGRFDDLFVFFGTKLEKDMIQYVTNTLEQDCVDCAQGYPITLLAKWMPSNNTSSKATRELAKKFIKAMGVTDREYRKILSKLRSHLDILEKKLCANKWNEVDYAKVPSQANLKYKNAFFKHDADRRSEYLGALEKGETKINAATLFPHDIVVRYKEQSGWDFKYKQGEDATLEELWKALPNYVNGNPTTLVVRDGSGSMGCSIGNTRVSALDVSTALAIYFAERSEGQFKNKFITFSSRPELVDLTKCSSLRDKLRVCDTYDDCSNTNIEATFDLVLNTAVNNNLKQEEIPNLLIISDMEFDNATTTAYETGHSGLNKAMNTLFGKIRAKFNRHGYDLPRLVFWYVNSRTQTIPLTQNENGVILVSGFSPAIVNMVLSEETDPYRALVKILESDRYKQVTLNK